MKEINLNIIRTDRKSISFTTVIAYSFITTIYGDMLVASLQGGLCFLEFADDRASAIHSLESRFAGALLNEKTDDTHSVVKEYLSSYNGSIDTELTINLVGTDFQYSVWKTLLEIPRATLCSYKDVAYMTGRPKAVRAVASVISSNPIAIIIPCHRVICNSGKIGGYRWGVERKVSLIDIERSFF